MREQVSWHIGEDQIFATLDIPEDKSSQSALLIVSGGNEIRSGSHNSQSELARHICKQGHYVLRYDRRGIGDSEGENTGFEGSEDDINSAVQYLYAHIGDNAQISAFGNCDAASALLLNCEKLNLKSFIIANPWTYDPQNDQEEENI
jgi:alpha/beta superfamily hydrolase